MHTITQQKERISFSACRFSKKTKKTEMLCVASDLKVSVCGRPLQSLLNDSLCDLVQSSLLDRFLLRCSILLLAFLASCFANTATVSHSGRSIHLADGF